MHSHLSSLRDCNVDGFTDTVKWIGDSGWTEYSWRYDKPSRGKASTEIDAERKLSDRIKDSFRIYFPTEETVAQSRGGIGVSCKRDSPLPPSHQPTTHCLNSFEPTK